MERPEDKIKLELYSLTLQAIEGRISESDFKRLEEILQKSSEAREIYTDLNIMYAYMRRPALIFDVQRESEKVSSFDNDIWRLFAEYESTAPAVEIPKEKPTRELIQKVVYPPQEKPKITKFSIFVLLNAAAVILVFFLLRFIHPEGDFEVATLTDSLNAKWVADGAAQDGARLVTGNQSHMLKQGYAKLLFDTDVQVVIEAPSEFQILAEDRLGLRYGKIYVSVPKEAIGFSVYTQNSKIIDMGTEFGVEADSWGDTRLHVLKGKTTLIAGTDENTINIDVKEGVAKSISGSDQHVTDIPCDVTYFARDFNSANTVIWREQPTLDLADVVRGGNGLGTGNSAVRLNPIKGLTDNHHFRYATAPGFLPIPELAFVDGIFVPDGRTQQIISTEGDVFIKCPETSGVFDKDVLANPVRGILRTNAGPSTIQFYNQDYTDDSGNTCIVMHANLGLTFDLNAVRQSYDREINRFTSQIGISDMGENGPANADFWVLVDGQVRYSLSQYKQKGVLNDISIEIQKTDRFLTLATTDGGDPDNPDGDFYQRAISCDWCVFTEPILVFE
jgi:hypothetical protein